MWYLPKHFWRFDWRFSQHETSVHVWDGARLVCAVEGVPANTRLFPLRWSSSVLNTYGAVVGTIPVDLDLRVASVPWELKLSPESPLQPLAPQGRLFTFVLKGVAEVRAFETREDG
jgi:hypothetical protein